MNPISQTLLQDLSRRCEMMVVRHQADDRQRNYWIMNLLEIQQERFLRNSATAKVRAKEDFTSPSSPC